MDGPLKKHGGLQPEEGIEPGEGHAPPRDPRGGGGGSMEREERVYTPETSGQALVFDFESRAPDPCLGGRGAAKESRRVDRVATPPSGRLV